MLIVSCKQKESKQKKIPFAKYPVVPCNDTSYINSFIKPSEKYLNLSLLENGVDSFEMRLYINRSFDVITELFLIKATKDSLIKSHYYYKPMLRISPDGTMGYNKPNFSLMSTFNFKDSDTSFLSLLNDTKIDTLPTEGLTKNLQGGCTDGETYFVEMANKKSYRAILYSTPHCYNTSVDHNKFEMFLQKFLSSIIYNQKYKDDFFLKNHFKQ